MADSQRVEIKTVNKDGSAQAQTLTYTGKYTAIFGKVRIVIVDGNVSLYQSDTTNDNKPWFTVSNGGTSLKLDQSIGINLTHKVKKTPKQVQKKAKAKTPGALKLKKKKKKESK